MLWFIVLALLLLSGAQKAKKCHETREACQIVSRIASQGAEKAEETERSSREKVKSLQTYEQISICFPIIINNTYIFTLSSIALYLSDNYQIIILCIADIDADLFKMSREYSDQQKRFASTVHFYSPKAYGYLRQHFKLPHPSTIRRYVLTVPNI